MLYSHIMNGYWAVFRNSFNKIQQHGISCYKVIRSYKLPYYDHIEVIYPSDIWVRSLSLSQNLTVHIWGQVMHILVTKIRPLVVQIMFCHLFWLSAEPLSKPMLAYCWLDPWEQTWLKFDTKYNDLHTRKLIRKCCLLNGSYLISISIYYECRLILVFQDLPEHPGCWRSPIPSCGIRETRLPLHPENMQINIYMPNW